jgi:hypothetical protein
MNIAGPNRSVVLALLLLVETACLPVISHRDRATSAAHIPPRVQVWKENLRLRISSPVVEAQASENVPLHFVLTNVGTQRIDACFGEAWEFTLMNDKRKVERTHLSVHSLCESHFSADPGQQVTKEGVIAVPDVGLGPAEMTGWVEVVDPKACDRYGCDSVYISSESKTVLKIVSGSKIQK